MKSCQDENVVTRPSMKDRVRALREEAILDAAAELILAKGFVAMTLDDITETVGISKPTLYLHFRSKEDVIERLAMRCMCQADDYLGKQCCGAPATDRLNKFIYWCMDAKFGEDSLLFQNISKHVLPSQSKDSERWKMERKITDAVNDLFVEAQREGGIRKDVPAIMLSAMLLGFVKNARVDEIFAEGNLDMETITNSWINLLRGC